jgi:hypothetical protein
MTGSPAKVSFFAVFLPIESILSAQPYIAVAVT